MPLINKEKNTKASSSTQSERWRGLPAISILYILMDAIKGFRGAFIYLVPGLFFGFNKIKQNPTFFIPVLVLVLSVILFFCLARFYSYRFRMSENDIEVRYGVFNKVRLHIQFDRIQNIVLRKPLVYRASGYTCIDIDTAGSSKQEINIIALGDEQAQDLKSAVINYDNQNAADVLNAEAQEKSRESLVIRRSLDDIVLHGVTSNRVWFFAALAGGLFSQAQGAIGENLAFLEVFLSNWFQAGGLSILFVAKFVFLALLVTLFFVVLSIIGSVISFYSFTLSKVNDRYVRRSGLLSKNEISVRISRIQALEYCQTWLDAILNRGNIRYRHSRASSGEGSGLKQTELLVPSVCNHQIDTLISDIYPHFSLRRDRYMPVSRYFFVRRLRYLIVLSSVTIISVAYASGLSLWLLVIALFFAMLAFASYQIWRRCGIYLDREYIYLRHGFLGRKYVIIPIYKIQQLQQKSTVWMRARKLSNLHIVLASGAYEMPCLDQDEVQGIINYCLFKVESEPRSWM